MITNRRKFHRIPVEEKCIVRIDGVDLECHLVDQSITGAKIAGLDFLVIPYGKPLSIIYDGESFDAIIRGVTRDEKNEMLIGIERSETADPDSIDKEAMLLNCYIRHEGNLMVCIPISVEADGRVCTELRMCQWPDCLTHCSNLNLESWQTAMRRRLARASNRTRRRDQSPVNFACPAYLASQDSWGFFRMENTRTVGAGCTKRFFYSGSRSNV